MSSLPTFAVTAEPDRDLVRWRIAGLLTPEAAAGLVAARNAAHRTLRCGPNQQVTIADLRGMAIQTQDVVGRFGLALADPAYRSRRLAVLTSSALARMQIGRILADSPIGFFDDLAEAEAWALAPEPEA